MSLVESDPSPPLPLGRIQHLVRTAEQDMHGLSVLGIESRPDRRRGCQLTGACQTPWPPRESQRLPPIPLCFLGIGRTQEDHHEFITAEPGKMMRRGKLIFDPPRELNEQLVSCFMPYVSLICLKWSISR